MTRLHLHHPIIASSRQDSPTNGTNPQIISRSPEDLRTACQNLAQSTGTFVSANRLDDRTELLNLLLCLEQTFLCYSRGELTRPRCHDIIHFRDDNLVWDGVVAEQFEYAFIGVLDAVLTVDEDEGAAESI